MGKLERDWKQPCLGWRQGSVTPVCQWQPMPHNAVYPSSTCACALVCDATALASMLPKALSGGGKLYLGLWWKVGKVASWVWFMHLKLKDCLLEGRKKYTCI